jgi:hypothetical protein
MSYIFSRSTQSVQPDYAAATKAGATVALNAEDPDLPNQIARARANGQNPAIWLPSHTEQDPQQYAARMAGLVSRYGPSAILPNIEIEGQGENVGWSKQMMDAFGKYYPPGSTKLDVVVEGSKPQGMFDYKPYLPYGDVVVESFWGDMSQRDPNQMRQILMDSGVPPDKINLLLAPGQQEYQGGGKTSAYTLDDMKPEQLATFLTNYQKNFHTPYEGRTDTQPMTTPGQRRTLQQTPGQLPTLTHQAALNAAAAANRAASRVTPSRLDAWSNPAAQAQARRQLAAQQMPVGRGVDAVQMLQDYKTVQDRNLAALAPARAAAGWDYDVRTAPSDRALAPTRPGTTAQVPGGAWTQQPNTLPRVAPRTAAPAATPRYTATAPRPTPRPAARPPVRRPPPRR